MVVNTTVQLQQQQQSKKHTKSEFKNSFESETNACFDNDIKQSIENGWMFVHARWLVQHILSIKRYYELDLSDFWRWKILARCVINSAIWANAWAHTNGVWVCVTFLHIHLLPYILMHTPSIVQYFQIAIECICVFFDQLHNTGRDVCNSHSRSFNSIKIYSWWIYGAALQSAIFYFEWFLANIRFSSKNV